LRDIVVAQLSVAETMAMCRAKRRVDAGRPHARGIRIAYTGPLWGASALTERVARRIVESLGETEPSSTGVALLGHGQPTEMESVHPGLTEHETLFSQRVRAALVERGFDGGRVRLGWMEWQDPGAVEVVRHLAALGCSRIVVVPAVMPVDTLSTMLDVHDAIVNSRVDVTDVDLLPAWGDDPVVAEVLAEAVRDATSEFASA
jgi:protoheme ferro-lyase